jgi:hypothetical protein
MPSAAAAPEFAAGDEDASSIVRPVVMTMAVASVPASTSIVATARIAHLFAGRGLRTR